MKAIEEQKSILQKKMEKMKGTNCLQLNEKSKEKDIISPAPFSEPKVKPIIELEKKDTKNKIEKPKERKSIRTISSSSESDVANAEKLKCAEVKERKSQVKEESKASKDDMRGIQGRGISDEQMNTGKSMDTDENQAYFTTDDNRMDSNGNTLSVKLHVPEVKKTAGTQHTPDKQVKQHVHNTEEHNNLSDAVTESYEVTKLKKLNESLADDLTDLKNKYRQLQEKYNKQTERLETLQFLNEKLQTQLLFNPSTEKSKVITTKSFIEAKI